MLLVVITNNEIVVYMGANNLYIHPFKLWFGSLLGGDMPTEWFLCQRFPERGPLKIGYICFAFLGLTCKRSGYMLPTI